MQDHILLSQRLSFVFTLLLSTWLSGYAQQRVVSDTCTVNDLCENAIAFPSIDTDSSSYCLQGCMLDAQPDVISTHCGMDTMPTVWYKVTPDDKANLMNLYLTFPNTEAYYVSVFKLTSDCNSLEPIVISINNVYCRKSFGQRLDLGGILVDSLTTYMIAVTSEDQSGGAFTICASFNEDRIPCLLRGDILITDRSSGQEEDAPYLPGEQVSVCMAVKEYQTGGFNGCQWFQGMVPYFGSAWDPSGFDDNGQPFNATVNGVMMGEAGNGLYDVPNFVTTWDWFGDVGYHWTNDTLQIGDRDGNGTVDLCSSMHEDCFDFGGVTGGCCGACWDDAGQLLPPGWFAYGINGSCPETGHPTVEWGDGNICYGSMGPWYFCFDLQVKTFPECLQNAPEDLKMSFYTKSDGEIGAFTGSLSLCVGDKPRTRQLSLACGTNVEELDAVTLTPVCIGDTALYLLSEENVIHWYWNVEPTSLDYPTYGNAPNGATMKIPYSNTDTSLLELTYFLRGSLDSIGNYVSRIITVQMYPYEFILEDDSLALCETVNDSAVYTVSVNGDPENFSFYWPASGDTTPYITIYPPYVDTTFTVVVTDSNGCIEEGVLMVSEHEPCVVFEFDAQYDESNEQQNDADPPSSGGRLVPKPVAPDTDSKPTEGLMVYPVPAKDKIIIKWPGSVHSPSVIMLMNADGAIIQTIPLSDNSSGNLELNISDFPPGIYMAVLQEPHSLLSSRFIKM